MPGRIVNMTTNGVSSSARSIVNGKQSPAGAVQPAQPRSPSPSRPHSQSQVQLPAHSHPPSSAVESLSGLGKRSSSVSLANGEHGIPGLGAYPTPNGVSPASPSQSHLPASMSRLPDEIQHITEGFYSLGTLIKRVTQSCFSDLSDTIDQLSRIPVDTQPQVNGAGAGSNVPPPGAANNTPENRLKKKILMEFLEEYRSQFIKLLVLSRWSESDAEPASFLIDANFWLNTESNYVLDAEAQLFALWNDLRTFKIGSPDLDTAFAVLSKGDVPWIPHLNFRKQELLSAREILKTLRQMNTMINIRLVLHEDLIPQLRDYRVADGRATFQIPGEFELDVYTLSDDATSPWYFAELRFLFTPAPQINGDGLLRQVDDTVNGMLNTEGLTGACDFIHNFVLTHKITILHRQALELRSSLWAAALGIELIHRTLIVQYWLGSKQAKSWVEIGITSGREKGWRKRKEQALSSRIRAKWIRNGKEQDLVVPMDLDELSIERTLNTYIARHSSYILNSIRDRLEAVAETRSKDEHKALTTRVTKSETEPLDCNLHTQLGAHPAMHLKIDPITGRLYLDPVSPATLRAQPELDNMKDPFAEAHILLSRCLSYDILVRIEHLADLAGWVAVKNHQIRPEIMKAATKREASRYGFYQPNGFQGSNWYIAYAINLCGESWWVTEIKSSPTGGSSSSLGACRRLPTADVDGRQPSLSLQLLKRLEQLAVRACSYTLADQDFKAKGAQTAMKYLSTRPSASRPKTDESQTLATTDSPEKTLPALVIRFSQLLKSKSDRFACDLLQLRYLSFDTNIGQVKLVARGRMRHPSKVQDILKHTRDADIGFSLDGSFSILVRAKLGASCADKVVAHLKTLSTLCNFARVLNSHNLDCKHISFSKVCFKYGDNLDVTLVFAGSESQPHIKVELAPNNPHVRVKALLEEIVNDHEMGFERFTIALEYFLPVLRAFQTIDSRHALSFASAPRVLPRAVDFYRLSYPNPLAPRGAEMVAVFDLNFKRNKDDLEWRISEMSSLPWREERDRLFPGLNAGIWAFMKQVGEGWTGMNTLVVADRDGVEEAILKLDEVVSGALRQNLGGGGDDGFSGGETAGTGVALDESGAEQQQQQQHGVINNVARRGAAAAAGLEVITID